jgi:hypothetical protein
MPAPGFTNAGAACGTMLVVGMLERVAMGAFGETRIVPLVVLASAMDQSVW